MTLVCDKEVLLPEPSDRAVLIYIRDFLCKQGKKSKNIYDGMPEGICGYRSTDRTCACAVGCLIPDDEYDCIMENSHITSFRISESLKQHGYKNFFLLRTAQFIHDNFDSNRWKEFFNDLIGVLPK